MATSASKSDLPPNIAAALSYVLGFITGIIFLLISKDKFVRFHAWQSILTSLVFFVINIILGFIPSLAVVVSPLVSIVSLVVFIFLIVKAYQGKKFMLPVIGNFAESKV